MSKAATGQAAAAATSKEEQPLLDRVLEATAGKLDTMAARFAHELGGAAIMPLKRAMLTAAAIEQLDKALDAATMQRFMRLMNTELGFKTDRPSKSSPQPYPVDVVKSCIIDALLKGFFPVNNEFNIIAGRFYGAQNGYRRKVEEFPGIKNIEMIPGVPRMDNGIMCIRMGVRWLLGGVQQELRDGKGEAGRVFTLQQNSASTPDNNIGKATRKAYKAAYEFLTSTRVENDEEPDECVAVPQPPTGRHNIRKEKENGQPSPAPAPVAGPEAPRHEAAPAPAPAPEPTKSETGDDGEVSEQQLTMERDDRSLEYQQKLLKCEKVEEIAAVMELVGKDDLTESHLIPLRQLAEARTGALQRRAGAGQPGKAEKPKGW